MNIERCLYLCYYPRRSGLILFVLQVRTWRWQVRGSPIQLMLCMLVWARTLCPRTSWHRYKKLSAITSRMFPLWIIATTITVIFQGLGRAYWTSHIATVCKEDVCSCGDTHLVILVQVRKCMGGSGRSFGRSPRDSRIRAVTESSSACHQFLLWCQPLSRGYNQGLKRTRTLCWFLR